MIKSVFVGLNLPIENYEKLGEIGANHLIIPLTSITKEKRQFVEKLNSKLGISISCFGTNACPANPLSMNRLIDSVKKSLDLRPDEIWLDHFRFDGVWESTFAKISVNDGYLIADTHKPCKWCKGKKRVEIIARIAKDVRKLVENKVKLGYFAVPFKKKEIPDLVIQLGQDHELLGKIFDITSPMLYHRMINKQVSYISEYVKYISKFNLPAGKANNSARLAQHKSRQVIPIIQVKDMPDLPAQAGNLVDKLTKVEFLRSYRETIKSPSKGVSIFSWEHAIEENKVSWINEVFKK